MKGASTLRWFAAVSPPARPLTASFGVLALAAGPLEAVNRGSSDWVLASIALLQLFATSTGFTRHASRGYYDPVLLGGRRLSLALAHFATSASPGLAAWLACGAAEAIAARSPAVPAFRASGWVALLLVSAIPWATSVRTAPFVGGTLWVLLFVTLVVSGRILGPLGRLHAQPGWVAEHPAAALALGLAFPPLIPSLRWPTEILLGLAGIAAAALAGGVLAVSRAEVALAEEGD